jgi:hypothetical protein
MNTKNMLFSAIILFVTVLKLSAQLEEQNENSLHYEVRFTIDSQSFVYEGGDDLHNDMFLVNSKHPFAMVDPSYKRDSVFVFFGSPSGIIVEDYMFDVNRLPAFRLIVSNSEVHNNSTDEIANFDMVIHLPKQNKLQDQEYFIADTSAMRIEIMETDHPGSIGIIFSGKGWLSGYATNEDPAYIQIEGEGIFVLIEDL